MRGKVSFLRRFNRQISFKILIIKYLLINYKISYMNKDDMNKDITVIRKNNTALAFLKPLIPIQIEKI